MEVVPLSAPGDKEGDGEGDGSPAGEIMYVSRSPTDSRRHRLLPGEDASQVRLLVLTALDCADFNSEVRLTRVF